MVPIHVLPEAECEIGEASRWYESKRHGLGLSFIAAVDGAIEKISEHPLSYPLWKEDRPYRKALLKRFPFVVFFTVGDDSVQVVAVAHQKRRPGYWTERQAAK